MCLTGPMSDEPLGPFVVFVFRFISYFSSYGTVSCENCDAGYEAKHYESLNCTMCPKGMCINQYKPIVYVLKFQNTFHFLFTNKMFVIRTGIHKMHVRIANREDPHQTASSEAV